MYVRFDCDGRQVIPPHHFEARPGAGEIVSYGDADYMISDDAPRYVRETYPRGNQWVLILPVTACGAGKDEGSRNGGH